MDRPVTVVVAMHCRQQKSIGDHYSGYVGIKLLIGVRTVTRWKSYDIKFLFNINKYHIIIPITNWSLVSLGVVQRTALTSRTPTRTAVLNSPS